MTIGIADSCVEPPAVALQKCLWTSRQRRAAEDAVQDALLAAYKHLDQCNVAQRKRLGHRRDSLREDYAGMSLVPPLGQELLLQAAVTSAG
jgi:hypothetical protein